ncbi:hypothetical protein HY994_02085 [Candidatus Micrarchaeota archaeon]|nr:hypothetical protein [Candidatus Micrarchaeota archaeon]
MAKKSKKNERQSDGTKTPKASAAKKTASKIKTILIAAPLAALLAVGGFHWAHRFLDRDLAQIIRVHDIDSNAGELKANQEVDAEKPEFKTKYRTVGLNIYPNSSACLKCHTYEDADVLTRQTLEKLQKEMEDVFGPDAFHHRVRQSVFVFPPTHHPIPGRPSVEGVGGPAFASFGLPELINPKTHRVVQHELIHDLLLSSHHYLNEPLAYTSEFIIHPELVQQTTEDLVPNEMGHGISLMQRAQILGHNTLGNAQMLEQGMDLPAIFTRLAQQVKPAGVSAMRPFYRDLMSQYLKNNTFWDAGSAWLQHPYLIHDVLIAQWLEKNRNPLFEKAKKNRAEVDKTIRFLNQLAGIVKMHPSESRTTFDQHHVDLRQRVLYPGIPESMDPNRLMTAISQKSQAERDANYFAAIHRMFVNPNGSYRQQAIPRQVLFTHAEARAHTLENIREPFEKLMFFGDTPVDHAGLEPKLRPYYQERMQRYLDEGKEIRKRIKTGRFIE